MDNNQTNNIQPMQPYQVNGNQPIPNTMQTAPTQQPNMERINTNQNINQANIQQQMQTIPTVDQSKQEFITNQQSTTEGKKEEKKNGPNIAFIVILFIIIFASMFFLFPYLLNVLG